MAFLVFEGIDGCGKSTLIDKLNEYLIQHNIETHLTREPGGTPLAEEIREIIIRKGGEVPHPRTEILLYEAARAQHVEKVIRPNLGLGQWVLSDRFTASSLAFQAGGRELREEDIIWLNNYAIGGVEPDFFILLDLSVDEALKRRQKRESEGQQADRFEGEKRDFHQSVRDHYLKQASQTKNWIVLDANQTPDELLANLLTQLKASGCLRK